MLFPLFYLECRMIQFWSALGALLAAAIWGFAFVVVKDSLTYISPVYIISFRFTISVLIMAALFWKRLKKINKKYLWKGSLIGVFLFMAYLLQTVGCNYTTPGKNAFFTTVYVLIIPFLSWIFVKVRPKANVFIAVVIQIIGIGFLSLSEDIRQGISLNRGDILTLLCGLFYAFQIFLQGHFSQGSEEDDPVVYAFIEFFSAGILGWLISPFYDLTTGGFTLTLQPVPFSALSNPKVLISVLYLGIFSTAISFTLQNFSLKYLKYSIATILLSFESVFGMLFSILIPVNGVRERLTLGGVIGCVLIFAAVIIAEKDDQGEAVQ